MPSGPDPTSVVLATDGSFVGDGLVSQLAEVPEVGVVGRTHSHLDLRDLVAQNHPGAAIISTGSPGGDVPVDEVARRLRHEFVDLGIVIITGHSDLANLESGCHVDPKTVYLSDGRPLDLADVLGALRLVCRTSFPVGRAVPDSATGWGRPDRVGNLSNREPLVLEQMAEGRSNRAIASEMNISVKSIEKDVTTIFRKLELGDPSLVDRRVTAALAFLHSSAAPFGSDSRAGGGRR